MHHQAQLARRLLGNQLFLPGATLPASTAGYPTRLLVAAALNPEARLRLVDRLPPEQRSSLNERSLSSDSAEGQFGGIKSRAGGVCPTAPMVSSCSGTMDWQGLTQAMPAEERGFVLAGVSRTYEGAEAESAEGAAGWNNACILFDAVAAQEYIIKLSKKLSSKVKSSCVLVTRDVHKCMR